MSKVWMNPVLAKWRHEHDQHIETPGHEKESEEILDGACRTRRDELKEKDRGLAEVKEAVLSKAKEARIVLKSIKEKMTRGAGRDLEHQHERSAWHPLLDLAEQGQVITYGEAVHKPDTGRELQSGRDNLEELRSSGMVVAAGKPDYVDPLGMTAHVKDAGAVNKENLPAQQGNSFAWTNVIAGRGSKPRPGAPT